MQDEEYEKGFVARKRVQIKGGADINRNQLKSIKSSYNSNHEITSSGILKGGGITLSEN